MNWRRLSIFLLAAGSAASAVLDALAEQPVGAKTDLAAPSAPVQRWVADLDSDQFVVRELATKKLIDAGTQAIQPVVGAMSGNRRETIARGVYILEQLAACGDRATEQAAQGALEQVAGASNSLLARRAEASLDKLELARQRRAMKALHWLGARFQLLPDPLQDGRHERPYAIEIDEQWSGSQQHLKHLSDLVDIQRVVFCGPQVEDSWLASIGSLPQLASLTIAHANISDQGLAHLAELKSLRRLNICYTAIGDGSVEHLQRLDHVQGLMIYGSNISSAGVAALRDKLEPTRLDVRNGAFLGVGADPQGQPCVISTVRPASAAEQAGLQVGDVIVRYNDQKVEDFTALRELIGNHRAGDNVVVKIERGTEQMVKRITLGEWDYHQLTP